MVNNSMYYRKDMIVNIIVYHYNVIRFDWVQTF